MHAPPAVAAAFVAMAVLVLAVVVVVAALPAGIGAFLLFLLQLRLEHGSPAENARG